MRRSCSKPFPRGLHYHLSTHLLSSGCKQRRRKVRGLHTHAFQQPFKSHGTRLFRKILELPAALNPSQSGRGTEDSLRNPSSLFQTRQKLNQPRQENRPRFSSQVLGLIRATLTPDTGLNSPLETCKGRSGSIPSCSQICWKDESNGRCFFKKPPGKGGWGDDR